MILFASEYLYTYPKDARFNTISLFTRDLKELMTIFEENLFWAYLILDGCLKIPLKNAISVVAVQRDSSII